MSEREAIFAGSVPENYHRYLVPLIFDEYARDLAGRTKVSQDGTVLEIACGTGILTRHLRASLPVTTSIVATDINPPMLEVAQAELEGLEAIGYRTADGTALPFPDASFEAVVCQFGVMFFPDKDLGYREAARVLKPAGTFIFNVWDSLDHNVFSRDVHEKVVELFPEDPPQFLALPYEYHDISRIKMQLQAAGFEDIHFFVLPRESRAPSAREVALAYAKGTPLAVQLAERRIEDVALEQVHNMITERYGKGAVAAPMQAITILAHLPGAGEEH